MSKDIYVVTTIYNAEYERDFNVDGLFFDKQDAINFLEEEGFELKGNDYYETEIGDLATARIELHQVKGEINE